MARQIKGSRPDFIFSTVVGEGIVRLHHALAQNGVDPYATPVASHMSGEAEVRALGTDLAEGLITCASYFRPVDAVATRSGPPSVRPRFGDDPASNGCAEAAYFQMHLLAEAMRRAEGDEPARVARALPGLAFDAPQGQVRVDEHNNHTYLNPRIGRCNARGAFEVIARAPGPVTADPYLISHSAPAWTACGARPVGSGLMPLLQ